MLVSSEPAAKWVLIVQDTYVEFQPPSTGTGSSLSTPTSTLLSPLRSHSGGSGHSEISEMFSSASQHLASTVQTTQPSDSSYRGHRSSHSDPVIENKAMFCAPTTEEDSITSSQNEPYGIVSNLPQMMQSFIGGFFRRSDQNLQLVKEERRPSDSEVGKEEKFHFPPSVSPSKSYHSGMTGQHTRQLSWHSWTLKEEAERKHLPLYVSTPEFDAPLRVQALPAGEDIPWTIDHCFDVFVHPLTLPDLYHASILKQSYARRETSFLVRLSVDGCMGGSTQSEGKKDAGLRTPSSLNSERREMQTPEVKLDEPERDMLSQVVTGLWREITGQPQTTQTAGSGARPQQQQPPASQCQIAVARLVFATNIQFGRRSKRSSSLEEAVSRENSYTSSPEASSPSLGVAIIPGHVLMSDLLRQQLGLKVNSVVRLMHVKEQWRILCRFYKVSVILTPLTNTVSNRDMSGT